MQGKRRLPWVRWRLSTVYYMFSCLLYNHCALTVHFRSYRSVRKNIIKTKRGRTYEFAINLSFSLLLNSKREWGMDRSNHGNQTEILLPCEMARTSDHYRCNNQKNTIREADFWSEQIICGLVVLFLWWWYITNTCIHNLLKILF